jgi:hypothetical protein
LPALNVKEKLPNFESNKTSDMKNLFFFLLITLSQASYSQCDIIHKISPDGTMFFYILPVSFYYTADKSLKGGLVTDKENYYVALQPSPFPEKSITKKMKGDLELKLGNNKVYSLKHFDTKYLKNDSIMQLLYAIDKKDLNDFLTFEAVEAKINMMGTEGIRSYLFKLHKNALQEQLACFLNKEHLKNSHKEH